MSIFVNQHRLQFRGSKMLDNICIIWLIIFITDFPVFSELTCMHKWLFYAFDIISLTFVWIHYKVFLISNIFYFLYICENDNRKCIYCISSYQHIRLVCKTLLRTPNKNCFGCIARYISSQIVLRNPALEFTSLLLTKAGMYSFLIGMHYHFWLDRPSPYLY